MQSRLAEKALTCSTRRYVSTERRRWGVRLLRRAQKSSSNITELLFDQACRLTSLKIALPPLISQKKTDRPASRAWRRCMNTGGKLRKQAVMLFSAPCRIAISSYGGFCLHFGIVRWPLREQSAQGQLASLATSHLTFTVR